MPRVGEALPYELTWKEELGLVSVADRPKSEVHCGEPAGNKRLEMTEEHSQPRCPEQPKQASR
jgi:hypothetical protein